VLQDNPGALPASVVGADYAKEIVQCYPFHPRLLATATDRLGALGEFQKSRGVLRLFARIIRDIWESKSDLEGVLKVLKRGC
jgi:predicted AAA+ superfamily ATPase